MNNKSNIRLTSYDDIFETDESRADAQLERVQSVSISNLIPFKDHPFKVIDDESMHNMTESISRYGVLTPLIVRPLEEGAYEIISGHRRAHAAAAAGLSEVPVLIRDMDDDAATVLMVDSNMQREHILPSEKAFAYKMKLEAMRHQGIKSAQTSSQDGMKIQTMDIIGREAGDSRNQVHRYIRLTNLIPDILGMVDRNQISFNSAVELSYLKQGEQQDVLDSMDKAHTVPSLSQAQQVKELSRNGSFTSEAAKRIIDKNLNGNPKRITFRLEQLRPYFPGSYTPLQMRSTIIHLLEHWLENSHME
ncbi:MAG: ParB/RepB/Spo0J family partition protein [Lachnospiraceae bacterium]|nr:ParB/RepB/Spo0J family partition protein [Lachnospiraceae bacterium]